MAVIVKPQENEQNQPQTGPDGQPLQTVGTAAPAGQGPSGTPMARSQANNLAQQQRKGSGRFTNLQKYIQANQGAGQRIAGQIGQNMQQQSQQQAEQAQKYYNQLGQNIQKAQQTAQAGAGYQQKLKDIGGQIIQATLTPEQLADQQLAQQRLAERQQQNLGAIEEFTQSPDFQKFQDIQAGRAIDENLLALQQQKSLAAAQQAAQQSQKAKQALGSEAGRFDLLKRAFGGSGLKSGYSQGQQRLDQVLLGQGSGLGSLQSQAQQQAQRDLQQQQLAASRQADVGRLAAQEQGLIGDINQQARANEEAYWNMLGSYVNPLNTQRERLYNEAEARFNALKGSLSPSVVTGITAPSGTPTPTSKLTPTSEPIQISTAEDLAKMGITGPTRVYNTLNDLAFQNIANRGLAAQTAADVANTQDLARYQALAKIAGITTPDQRIIEANRIGEAWSGKETGKGESLAERVAAAQDAFNKKSKETQLLGDMIAQGRIEGWAQPGARTDVNVLAKTGVLPLLESGKSAINPYLIGPVPASHLDMNLYNNAASVNLWNKLRDYLNTEGYGKTIGGEVETNKDIQGLLQQTGPLKSSQWTKS